MSPWNLSLDNWPGVLLALIPALCNLGIFFYVLFELPRRRLTRAFAFFTLSLVFLQLDDVFCRLSLTAETASFWDELFFGWMFTGSLGLYFALLYIRQENKAISAGMLLLLFAPAFFFETSYDTNLFDHHFTHNGIWGWVNSHNARWIDVALVYWIATGVLLMNIIIAVHVLKQKKGSLRYKQGIIIVAGMIIPTLQGIITQAVLPTLLHRPAITATSTFIIFFTLAVAIALSRYKLFSLTENLDNDLLINHIRDILFTVSPDKRIVFINPYGLSKLGLGKRNAESYSIREILPEHTTEEKDFNEKLLEPALAEQSVFNFNTRFRRQDNSLMEVLVSAVPIRDARRVEGVLVVASDITELKKAEQSLQEKNQALERINEELESFVYAASHDMKEPLRMVSNYTQLVARRYTEKLDETGKEFIRFAVEGVHRMQRMIDDLLSYSGIGRKKMKWENVDCNELAGEVRKNLSLLIEENKAQLIVSGLPAVQGVRGLLLQLFQNLIENAIKFRRKDVDPVVSVQAEKKNGQWLFSFRDNGIGIDPKYADRIFELFQRLHTQEEYQGSGLGLSVSRKIVELHEGEIWFESLPGEGTSFFFTLPVKK